MKQIRFTKEGYEKLQNDYALLQKERPAAVEDLAKARAMGDLSENGYYKSARAKLSTIDWQLRTMKQTLREAVVSQAFATDGVDINTTVTLKNNNEEATYAIVGDLEANPKEGKISLKSPIGQAIAGKRIGDKVSITTPSGTTTYEIVHIA